ncbi:MAG TPA: antibiotic biosynthesis monooxygenase [Dehalococcoidia bacterium]
MPYIRVSLMRPQVGREEEVERLLTDLLRFFQGQKGFIAGWRVSALDRSGEVGRITVWESEEDADHAANQQHVMAVRSELNLLLEEDAEHVERAFAATPGS